jgi:hypothetical protein
MRNTTIVLGVAVASLRAVLTAEQLQQALQHSQQFAAARGVVF